MSRIQNIAFQSILIFMSLSLIIFIIGCDQFPSPLRGKKAINLVMLLDCSSSTMTDRSFQEQSILEAAGWWAEKAAEGSKGKFEILIINNGIDDIISFY
ncbi:hypothetical protein JXL19_11905, partial [bacterium]|nr:hypothetical protein [bacterium]